MKKFIFLFAAFSLLTTNLLTAQVRNSDSEITWYGLDFTEAKLIGSEGFSDPEAIQSSFFKKWNNLLIMEKEKYDIKKFFDKEKVNYDVDLAIERNNTVDPETLVIDKSHKVDRSTVENIVQQYKSADKNGLGLLFVIESFNKTESKGYMWVTSFDIKTGQVIKSVRMEGKSGGFGLRNYWAKSIFNVMKSSKKNFN